MNALPIVERELLSRARQGRMHWVRVIAGGLGVLFSLQFFVLWARSSTVVLPQQGGYAYQTLSWLGFFLACGGSLLTVDCLSSERREGTLELLLLTRVSTLEVLFGKLAAQGLAAVLSLAALAPVLMLPVLTGGVTWMQVGNTILSLFSLLFFSLCLGLWASSGARQLSESVKRLAVCFVVIVLLPLLVFVLMGSAGMTTGEAAVLRSLSPAIAFVSAVQSNSTPWSGSHLSLGAGLVYGLFLLFLAARRLDDIRRGDRVEDPTALELGVRGSGRRALGDEHPLRWLLKRDRTQLGILWCAGGVGAALLLLRFVFALAGFRSAGIVLAPYYATGLASAALYAYAGARVPARARATGMLELLQTTPVGGAELGRQLGSVLRTRLVGPVALTVIVTLLQQGGYLLMSGPTGILRALLAVAWVILNATAHCTLGLWFGWRLRGPTAAVLWSVGLVWGLDLLISYGVFALAVLGIGSGAGGSSPLALVSLLVIPLLVCLKQVWLIAWARRRVESALHPGEMDPINLRKIVRTLLAAIQKARHWTPSG